MINSSQKGFTIVEALVALVVLTMALGPLIYLSNGAVNAAFNIRDDLIGANLASEAIEIVRNVRDTNWFNGLAFDTGLADGTYKVRRAPTPAVVALDSNPLKISNGLYSNSTGTDTKFYRTITITKLSNVELRVVAQVTWPLRGGTTKVTSVEEHLYNWK